MVRKTPHHSSLGHRYLVLSQFLLIGPSSHGRLFQPEPVHRLLKSMHIPIRTLICHCYMIIYVIIIYLRAVIIHLSCKWNALLSTRSVCLQSCMRSLNYRVCIWFGIVCTFDLFLLVYVLHSVYHKYTRWTKKLLSPWLEWNPWPTEHMAGVLSTVSIYENSG